MIVSSSRGSWGRELERERRDGGGKEERRKNEQLRGTEGHRVAERTGKLERGSERFLRMFWGLGEGRRLKWGSGVAVAEKE